VQKLEAWKETKKNATASMTQKDLQQGKHSW